ncbi:heat shock protein beta-1-like isoform X1 [Huso huso]|uniref:Heat shock protein beta-1-like isoform X1 n=1 Tax=Huso huso TaxID=61971 RepID=A0ABR0YV57_HUSHU
MAEPSRIFPRPLFRRDWNWDPFLDWAQPTRIFDQDFRMPFSLEENDLNWVDWARRRLSSSWPGYLQSPNWAPSLGKQQTVCRQGLQRQLSGGVSEVRAGPDSWKISLDVNHFTPEEITIKAKGGYVEISGKHEERQDEHGFVSRCFTRKYKLPIGVSPQAIASSLSPEGVLSVDVPLPKPAARVPVEIIIPVQVRKKNPFRFSSMGSLPFFKKYSLGVRGGVLVLFSRPASPQRPARPDSPQQDQQASSDQSDQPAPSDQQAPQAAEQEVQEKQDAEQPEEVKSQAGQF